MDSCFPLPYSQHLTVLTEDSSPSCPTVWLLLSLHLLDWFQQRLWTSSKRKCLLNCLGSQPASKFLTPESSETSGTYFALSGPGWDGDQSFSFDRELWLMTAWNKWSQTLTSFLSWLKGSPKNQFIKMHTFIQFLLSMLLRVQILFYLPYWSLLLLGLCLSGMRTSISQHSA